MAVARRECSKCKKNRALKFYVSSRGRVCSFCRKATQRTAARKQRVAVYGLTPEQYAELLEAQHGWCAICCQPRKYNLNVDHDHRVERESGALASVRGLLCRRCNKLLAVVGDNIGILLRAAEYLTVWPSTAVLGGTADRQSHSLSPSGQSSHDV